MIFLDTCVWMELLGVRTPVKTHEIKQAAAASDLLQNILIKKEKLVTCKEQLIELVSAIEKVTMKTVNQERKANNLSGVGKLKEFRKLEEFQSTKRLCETVIGDVKHFAEVSRIGEYDVGNIIQRLDLADINDCLYYDYCIRENIEFYTFDSDVARLGNSEKIHTYNAGENRWI